MVDEAEDLAGIRANAAMVVEKIGGASGLDHFGFDAPSVQWIDGFIERQRIREDVGPEFVDKMVSVLGSYLGECIIRTYGGKWSVCEEGWRVEFDEKNAAFPFGKVQKQFENGAGDSIYSFFTIIPIVFPALRPSGAEDDQAPPPAVAEEQRSWFRRLFKRG